MAAAPQPLVESIRDAIRRGGPVTFAWFMEQALYDPAHGYYSSGRARIGRAGDYFTNVSVGPLFGRLLAVQLAEMWEALGRPGDFTIVEQGAHGGELAVDILSAARADAPEFAAAIRYTMVEPFPILQARQKARLAKFGERVEWRQSLGELSPFCGVHLSNELLDAFPVHLVRRSGDGWRERHVDESGDGFAFVDLPLSDPRLATQLSAVDWPLPDGYITEVSLAAGEWITQLARKLERGFILAIDYGFARDEYYAPHRHAGTLRGYAAHRATASPLEQIGAADITAHVDWTSLVDHAAAAGLQLAGFTDQHRFITGMLTSAVGEKLAAAAEPATARALQTLLHPAQLGMKFQYLVLEKNVGVHPPLCGLRFARDSRTALGLLPRVA